MILKEHAICIIKLLFFQKYKMNWYKKIKKFTQAWNVPTDTFKDKLKAIYELEYRYQAINKNNNIMPQRKENILNQIEKKIQEIIPEIKNTFLKVFEKWLETHALLDPEQWAKARLEDFKEAKELIQIDVAIAELHRYTIGSVDYSKIRADFMGNIDAYMEKIPVLQKIKKAIQEEYKENIINELDEDEIEYFNEEHQTNFPATEEGVDEAIEYLEEKDITIELFDFIGDIENLVDIANNLGLFENLIFQIYKNLIFPHWYDYWKSQGIEETRKTIENVYKILQQNSNNIQEEIKKINIALNTAHQTGNLIEDYLEHYSQEFIDSDFFDYLSQGSYIEETDKALEKLNPVQV